MIIKSRRGFLTGLASALAAPAVVKAASLMSVRIPIVLRRQFTMEEYWEKIMRPMFDKMEAQLNERFLSDNAFFAETQWNGEQLKIITTRDLSK